MNYKTKNPDQFRSQFNEVKKELSRLLGVELNKKSVIKSPIEFAVKLINDLDNQHQNYKRDIELDILRFFTMQLKRLEDHNDKVFKKFKYKLKKINNLDNYYGLRFELNIASTLVKNCIDFDKTESPDFTLKGDNKTHYIECTGSRLTTDNKKDDYLYKISSAIRKKIEKEYCDNNAALFIDITNIAWNRTVRKTYKSKKFEIDKNEYKDFISNLELENNFGNYTLFCYIINTDLDRIQSSYIRIDMYDISDDLLSFMNKCFPISDEKIDIPIYLHEG
ncbi:MAG: hypothetical protein IIA77_00145 [Proteobacteria bacterium]|nr:hypothetical protein [Pseudomonadota bacterium]MCH8976986.1 hypothetical protein [Pseudomonadota bacterium]